MRNDDAKLGWNQPFRAAEHREGPEQVRSRVKHPAAATSWPTNVGVEAMTSVRPFSRAHPMHPSATAERGTVQRRAEA